MFRTTQDRETWISFDWSTDSWVPVFERPLCVSTHLKYDKLQRLLGPWLKSKDVCINPDVVRYIPGVGRQLGPVNILSVKKV
jgi:hypothetical protein